MPANSSSKFNDLLNKAVKGKQYNTVAETGLNQEFIVSEEYYSASGKECKRFVFNQKAFAACKEGVMWFGVRVF